MEINTFTSVAGECTKTINTLVLRTLDSDSMKDCAVTSLQDEGQQATSVGEEEQTLSESLPELSGHPLHGLGGDLCAKVTVKWRWGSSLSDSLTFTPWVLWCEIMIQTQKKGWTNLQFEKGMCVPAACVPAHSSCSQTLPFPPQNTAGR